MQTERPTSQKLHDLTDDLQRLERRDWWLWITTIVILLLLCVAVFSVAIPSTWMAEQSPWREQLNIRMRGLLGLVLLFSIFAVYQQYLIKALRKHLQAQVFIASELHARTETIERLAILDPLTGLFTRRFIFEQLPRELLRAECNCEPLIVLIIDLDNFTALNETYGAAVGDLALAEFARHLKKAIRSSDIPVRFGGDEFLVTFPHCGESDISRPIARMRGCEITHGPVRIPINFSVGYAQHATGESAVELLERADFALYANQRGVPAKLQPQSPPISTIVSGEAGAD